MVRALVTSEPAFRFQHGMPSSVVKLEEPQLLVQVIPLVPLRSVIPTVSVGEIPAFEASRASIKEIKDGSFDHPEYPAAHTSQEDDPVIDVECPVSHDSQTFPLPAAEYLPTGQVVQPVAELVLTILLCRAVISEVVSFWLRTPAMAT